MGDSEPTHMASSMVVSMVPVSTDMASAMVDCTEVSMEATHMVSDTVHCTELVLVLDHSALPQLPTPSSDADPSRSLVCVMLKNPKTEKIRKSTNQKKTKKH